MILKFLIIFALLLSSCNKDDENNGDQECVKDENFFEAHFNGETVEPYYNQGGGVGRYTLSFTRCDDNGNDWLLTINTENDLGLYLSFIGINGTGVYDLNFGDPNHIPANCAENISLYLFNQNAFEYSYLSSTNGTVEITENDNASGILVGTLTCEMVSTADPSVKKTITGEFNLNKSTLDKTKKPCWL